MARIQIAGLAIMTLLTIIVIMGQTKINCNDPETWSTTPGVQHCAVNGGK